MGTILLCADSASLADPAALGLGSRGRTGRSWLEVHSDAVLARERLRRGDPVEEAWVASSDQMGAVNLAAALRRDAPSIPVYLVAEGLSGSAISRAQAAGITGLLSPEGLARRIAHEERRRLGAAAREAALRAVAASAEPLALKGAAVPTASASHPVREGDSPAWGEALPPELSSSSICAPAPVRRPVLASAPEPNAEPSSTPDSVVTPAAPAPFRVPASVPPSIPAHIPPASVSAADTAPLPPVGASSLRQEDLPSNSAPADSAPVSEQSSERVSDSPDAVAKSPASVVAVVSGSGGAGKSTVAVLSACLAVERGLRTLLIDGDLQFGDAADLLGAPDAPALDEVAADLRLLDSLGGAAGPALVAAPRRLEQGEALACQLPRLLEAAAERFDVVVVNTGASWSETHAVIIERSARTLFLVDQRASSVRACRHALELCARCGIATGSFVFALNRCAKGAPLTSLDVSCALQGAPVRELRDGGAAVEDLLGSGMAAAFVAERNDLCASLAAILDSLLPNAASRDRGRRGRGESPMPSAPDRSERARGQERAGRKQRRWGRRAKPAVAIEEGAER